MDKALYDGWELKYFDKAFNFRNYQFELVKKFIRGRVAEVGPGNVLQTLFKKTNRKLNTDSANL